MSLGKIERPRLWIVAGPNGSGKSTLYTDSDIEDFGQSIWIINPDLLAKHIRTVEKRKPAKANLEAVIRIEKWLMASVEAFQTVGVETVLSTLKYRRLVRTAHKRQFEICFIYVVLSDVEENIRRVQMRVESGGHDVPEDKIRERYKRSLQQLPWFLEHADRAWLLDNSGGKGKQRLMATKQDGVLTVYPTAFAKIRTILRDYLCTEGISLFFVVILPAGKIVVGLRYAFGERTTYTHHKAVPKRSSAHT